MAFPKELDVSYKRKKKKEKVKDDWKKWKDAASIYEMEKNEIQKIILRGGGINQKFVFGQVRFEMLIKYPSGDVMQEIYINFRGEKWVEDINWWVFRI